jgi:hypothetical protein
MFSDYYRHPAFLVRTREVNGDPPKSTDSFRVADYLEMIDTQGTIAMVKILVCLHRT